MMTDRIRRALDGELRADQLDPMELETYLRFQEAFDSALEPIDRLGGIDVAPAVMRRIARPGLPRRALNAATGWLWSPRALSLTVRPAFAMAGAIAVAALVWTAVPAGSSAPAALAAAATAAPARVFVQFRLGAVGAREVALVGDFNGWRPERQLHEITPGVWSVDVALEPGVYSYGFMIDGKTVRLDPLAPQIDDGFGGASSRVAVLAPEIRS